MRRRQAFAEQAAREAQIQLWARKAFLPDVIKHAMSTPGPVLPHVEILSDGAACNPEFGVIEPAAKTCPKCGKVLPKHGAHFHVRACHG